MTEVAVPDARPPADIALHDQPRLVTWALEARQAAAVASSLARTPFVPASLRGPNDEATAANITGAILTGNELGLQPMAALRSLDIIQGTPALRAHAMRGLVLSHGHELVLLESTPERCRYRGRRKGTNDWQEVEWTIARAAALGLTGKQQWKNQPATMLIARATGEICRLIAADVLFAVPYAAEEIDGYTTAPQPAARPDPGADLPRSARSNADGPELERDAAVPTPVAPDSAAPTPPPTADAAVTPRRRAERSLFAELGKLKVTGRDDRLNLYSDVLGRPVGSTDDLTDADLDLVTVAVQGLVQIEDPEARDTAIADRLIGGERHRNQTPAGE